LLNDNTRPLIIEEAESNLRSSLAPSSDNVVLPRLNHHVKKMPQDCHSLFRAIALSMAIEANNNFFVSATQWVNNSAINELRDATADFLTVQAYQRAIPRERQYLLGLAEFSRTYAGADDTADISVCAWGNVMHILALANFILRPIVVLREEGEGQFIILWHTNFTSEQDIPVYLIATDIIDLEFNNLYIHHFDLYEPTNVSGNYQRSIEQLKQLKENWFKVQSLRKVELMCNRILFMQLKISGWTDWEMMNNFRTTLRRIFGGFFFANQHMQVLKEKLTNLGTTYYDSPWNLEAVKDEVLSCMRELDIQFPVQDTPQTIEEHNNPEQTRETENFIEQLVVNAETKEQNFGNQIYHQVDAYYKAKGYDLTGPANPGKITGMFLTYFEEQPDDKRLWETDVAWREKNIEKIIEAVRLTIAQDPELQRSYKDTLTKGVEDEVEQNIANTVNTVHENPRHTGPRSHTTIGHAGHAGHAGHRPQGRGLNGHGSRGPNGHGPKRPTIHTNVPHHERDHRPFGDAINDTSDAANDADRKKEWQRKNAERQYNIQMHAANNRPYVPQIDRQESAKIKAQLREDLQNIQLKPTTNDNTATKIKEIKDKVRKAFVDCLISIFNACKTARDTYLQNKCDRLQVQECTNVLHWKDVIMCGASTWDYTAESFMGILEDVWSPESLDMYWPRLQDLTKHTDDGIAFLDFEKFYVNWDKNEDDTWNVRKFKPFHQQVQRLRTKMMRQSMRFWVEALSKRFDPERYKDSAEDPYFVATINKRDIWDFLHPENIPKDEMKYPLPELCIKQNGDPKELQEFQEKFFPEDDPDNISELCKVVFRLRYWCAFDRKIKHYKENPDELQNLMDDDTKPTVDTFAIDMDRGFNDFFV